MKRRKFRDEKRALAASLVRQNPSPQPKITANQSPRRHARKLFIVKEVTSFPNTNVTAVRIQRILIFDNHPKTLRMVSLRHLGATLGRASFRPKHHDVILALFLMLLLAAAMFW